MFFKFSKVNGVSPLLILSNNFARYNIANEIIITEIVRHIIIISVYNIISNLECSSNTFTIVLVVIWSKLNSITFLSATIILPLSTFVLFITDGINSILIIITALIIMVITCNIFEKIEIVLLTIFNLFCFSLLNFTTLIFTSLSNESKSKILSLTRSFNLQ